jgi:hypothetical protein
MQHTSRGLRTGSPGSVYFTSDARKALSMALGAVINRLIRYCGLSRCFYAARGHLGFGAKGLQEGDLICVLPGSQVPLLLWKSSPSCYRLVSTCLVLGLMDGEAAERLGRGDATMRAFEIG